MILCKKRTFLSLFILLTQWHEFPASNLTNFHIFIILLPLNVMLFLRNLTAHRKKIMEYVALEGFLKKLKDVYSTILTAKMVQFVALVAVSC